MSRDVVLLRNCLASLRATKIEDKSDDDIAARMRVTFANGYQANIIRGPWSHGNERGLFEASVMHENRIVYDTPVTDDVVGFLDVAGVIEFCQKVAALPPRVLPRS